MKKINLVQEEQLEENFLPYKESLELKKLGFDFPCFAYYVGKDEELYYIYKDLIHNTNFSLNSRVAFRCPLYQQVFDWVREKHNINAWVSCFQEEDDDLKIDGTYSYFIYKDKQYMADQVDFETNKEAQMECIKTLIKLLKNE